MPGKRAAGQLAKSQWWPAWRWDQWLSVLLACGIALTLPSLALHYTLLSTPHQRDWQPPQPHLQQPLVVPVVQQQRGASLSAQLTARAVFVTDLDSGAVLFTKNPEEKIFPASVLKLLTALVVRDQFDLNDPIRQTWQATSSGTVIGLRPGESLTVHSALAASLIASGNDAAVLLATHDPEGVPAFVSKMQAKADQLHLQNTVVKNPTGLDDLQQHSSVRDLSLLAREIIKDAVLSQFVRTQRLSIPELMTNRNIWLVNTNSLLGVYPGVVGMKTGTTELAGENIILQIDKNGHSVIMVIANSLDRYQDARILLNWLDQNVVWKTFSGS